MPGLYFTQTYRKFTFKKQDFRPNCTSTLHGLVGFVTKNPDKAESERTKKFTEQILTTHQKIYADLPSKVGFLNNFIFNMNKYKRERDYRNYTKKLP